MLGRAFKESIPSIILSFLVPALLGYFVLPIPTDAVSNAMACGLDGAISAGLSCVITLMIFMKKTGNK